ncbi:MAG: trypsin-like serine protease [Polyangiales bacterium]
MTWKRAISLVMLVGCVEVAETAPDDSGQGSVSDEASTPVLAIQNGVSVTGAGPQQQWEGIVMSLRLINEKQGYVCSATFISERHLITAAHCYEKPGKQSIKLRAPGWTTDWETFDDATVFQASGGAAPKIDIAVVDIGRAPEWVTPERRFRIFAGTPTPADLHVYGYGARNDSGEKADHLLRAAPNNATVRVTLAGDGDLTGPAGEARICEGDSGGPAIKEGTLPVLWGINRSASTSILSILLNPNRLCPRTGANMQFTNISGNMAFIEKSLGRPCTRVEVDGQQAAQCW